jgi:hypothetical protein
VIGELGLRATLQTLDYWLLFWVFFAGTGAGITIINNVCVCVCVCVCVLLVRECVDYVCVSVTMWPPVAIRKQFCRPVQWRVLSLSQPCSVLMRCAGDPDVPGAGPG